MPKTKGYVGTRSQPKRLYMLAASMLVMASVLGIGKEFNFNLLNEIASPFRHNPPIKWRTREEALVESGVSRKPILYMVVIRSDDGSIRLEYDDFNQKDAYEYINDNYIPVKIYLKEKITEDSKVPKDLKPFSEQFNISYRQTAALFVVPAKLRNAKQADILSSGNLAELGVTDQNGNGYQNYIYYNNYEPYYGGRYESPMGHGPILNSYRTHADLMDFLFTAKNWHLFKPSTGLVRWQPESVLKGPKPAKPRVVVLLDDIGQESDHYRLSTLFNHEYVDLLNGKCTPVLLEYDTEHPERNKTIDALKVKYGLTSLPATIFVDAKDGKDDVVRGNSNEPNLCTFIRNGLGIDLDGVPNEQKGNVYRHKY